MATTTLTSPTATAPTSTAVVNAPVTTTTSTSPTISDLNIQLATEYGIAIISLIVAIGTLYMYRRGSFSKPMLSGVIIGAALLGLVIYVVKIVMTTQAKNAITAITITTTTTTAPVTTS